MVREKMGAVISQENLSGKMTLLWELYPELRGKTQNKLVNIAFEEWIDKKLGRKAGNLTKALQKLQVSFEEDEEEIQNQKLDKVEDEPQGDAPVTLGFNSNTHNLCFHFRVPIEEISTSLAKTFSGSLFNVEVIPLVGVEI